MKCPKCDHDSDTALLKCSACQTAFDRAALEEWQHVAFLEAWLQKQAGRLEESLYQELQRDVAGRQEALRQRLHLDEIPEKIDRPAPAAAELGRESLPESPRPRPISQAALAANIKLALLEAAAVHLQRMAAAGILSQSTRVRLVHDELDPRKRALVLVIGEQRSTVEPPEDSEVLTLLQDILPKWREKDRVSTYEARAIERYIQERIAGPEETPPVVEPTPEPEPTPAEPEIVVAPTVPPQESVPEPAERPEAAAVLPTPATTRRVPTPPVRPKRVRAPRKPREPIFDWPKIKAKVAEAAASGALVSGLLYLGAFMIVIALTILVIRFWDSFPYFLQIVFVTSVPVFFYAGGWVVRVKLKLGQVGGVFTGIGALLAAVDFAAIYNFGGLSGQVDPYLYWLGASLFCTALYALTVWRLPTEFFGYILFAALSSTLVSLAFLVDRPAQWTVSAVALAAVLSLSASLYLKPRSERWVELVVAGRRLSYLILPLSQVTAFLVPGSAAPGQSVTFALAAAGYGLLAASFPRARFLFGAVWSSAVSLALALYALGLPLAWFGAAAALAAPAYTLLGRWLDGRLDPSAAYRTYYRRGWYSAGFGLVALAAVTGTIAFFVELWAGVLALTLAAVVLESYALLFQQQALFFLGSGLFILPFSVAMGHSFREAHVGQWAAWLMAAWSGLSLLYIAAATRLERYGLSPNVWAHLLAPLALIGLLGNARFANSAAPSLVALGGVILVYLASAVLHDTQRSPTLSLLVNWLGPFARAAFLWPIGFLVPVWLAVAWTESSWTWSWFGPVAGGLALAYVGLGQLLRRRATAYRLPAHTFAYLLLVVGIALGIGNSWPLLLSLNLAVLTLIALAFVYRRVIETAAAGLLFIWPFQLALEMTGLAPHIYSLGYALLALSVYLPVVLALQPRGFRRPWGIDFEHRPSLWDHRPALAISVIAYGLAAYAVVTSLFGWLAVYDRNYPLVGVVVPLLGAGMCLYGVYRFQQPLLAWPAVLTLALGYGQTLALLRVPSSYDPFAWTALALAFMLAERLVTRRSAGQWWTAVRWPLGLGSLVLAIFGWSLTAGDTWRAFNGRALEEYLPLLLAQGLIVVQSILASRLYHSRRPMFVEPWLAFVPATLYFVGYGESLFSRPLTTAEYSLVWVGLSLVHLLSAFSLDRRAIRYAHGLYLGGYALLALAVGWSTMNRLINVYVLGAAILLAATSQLVAHWGRHRTFEEFRHFSGLSGDSKLSARLSGVIFLFIAVYSFPIWLAQLLAHFEMTQAWQALALSITAFTFVVAGYVLRRAKETYGWPWNSAAPVLWTLGWLLTAANTAHAFGGGRLLNMDGYVPTILAQGVGVAALVLTCRLYRSRLLLFLEPWLAFLPTTLFFAGYGQSIFGRPLATAEYSLVWTGLAIAHLVAAFALDRRAIRYAHGLYLGGYALVILAVGWSAPDRLVNVYVLGAAIIIAAVSQVIIHLGRQRTFTEFLVLLWPEKQGTPYRVGGIVFLFLAAYAFPVWLVQLLTHLEVSLAWRGTAFALAAPLYIAAGLVLRRAKPEYTWPLYSAGYALTGLGAMIAFDDQRLAIATLSLNTVVYAVSAYIFRQPFWLYLSTVLTPIVALLALDYNGRLDAAWIAPIFMTLAVLYLAAAQWFDRRASATRDRLSAYALPFYGPGYLLSAIALAVGATAALEEKWLVIGIYLVGIVLYGLSAWRFKEPIFIYPAAWIALLPYYLLVTLTPLAVDWHGLALVPLVVVYIGIGRFVFHKESLGMKDVPSALAALTHPALPFYLLAYAASVALVLMSQAYAWPFTWSLLAGTAIYFGSAVLFRRPAWLYPGLFAAHLALTAYLAIDPSGSPAHYMAIPFHLLTWLLVWIGYALSRRFPVARRTVGGAWLFRVWRWELSFGGWPALGHLLTPSWAQPFFFWVTLDIFTWQGVALAGYGTGIGLAIGHALMLGALASLWRDGGLVYASLAFWLLGTVVRLNEAGLTFAEGAAWLAGVGFGFYLVGRLLAQLSAATEREDWTSAWRRPLTRSAFVLATLGLIATLPTAATQTLATSAALAFAGGLYLAFAYRGRYRQLGYLAAAMLELSWVLLLLSEDVSQPQLYAIPAGLYFIALGVLERRRDRFLYANYLEGFGLAVLLLTSFIQSLSVGTGFPYFFLLLVESLLAIGWGALRRCKVPFFSGFAFSGLNIVAQLVLVAMNNDVMTWVVILGAGTLLVAVVIFIQLRFEQIRQQIDTWRDTLEGWG